MKELNQTRGQPAGRPEQISKEGWWDVLVRVKTEVAEKRFAIIAAGVAFYALLAATPALAALVSIYGLVFDPQQAMDQIAAMRSPIPAEVVDLLDGELKELTQAPPSALGLGVAGGLLLAIWSVSSGVRALMEALNVAYDEEEKRGFFTRMGLSLLLTLGALMGGIAAVGAVVLLPAMLNVAGLGKVPGNVVYYVRWPILAAMFWLGLMVMYRYGPSRNRPRWAWVSPGGLLATVLWLAASALFSWYVESFGNYNKTYGSMGAVVILLMWLLLSAYVVLIGAKINAESERQARKDSTVGEPQPLADRRAYAADTVEQSDFR
jgi:membrane protein